MLTVEGREYLKIEIATNSFEFKRDLELAEAELRNHRYHYRLSNIVQSYGDVVMYFDDWDEMKEHARMRLQIAKEEGETMGGMCVDHVILCEVEEKYNNLCTSFYSFDELATTPITHDEYGEKIMEDK